jgi:hypothetical protein
MEYVNAKLQKIREKIALDRQNAVVPTVLSIVSIDGKLSIIGKTSGVVLIPTVKAAAGAIQFTNADSTDTQAVSTFKFIEEDGLLTTPGSLQFGTIYNPSYIIFPDGTTQGSASTLNLLGGVTFTGPIRGSSLYLTEDLIVTGQIVTSTGIFGATANALIEPVDNMTMDGGEF